MRKTKLAYFQLYRPDDHVTFLISRSGKVNGSRVRSVEEAEEATKKLCEILSTKLRKQVATVEPLKIVNVVGVFGCQKEINLSGLNIERFYSYEPELFPAVIRRQDGRPTLIVYHTGKIVIVGARSDNVILWIHSI